MENSTPNLKKSAANYGIMLGVTLALITATIYAIKLELLTEWWIGIITFFLAIAISIVSVAKSKSLLDGFISFKQAFTSYFITIAVGLLIAVVVNILIFVVIDPDAALALKEQIIEVTVSMMERFGTPDEAINEAVEKLENENSFSVGSQLQSYIIQLLIYAVPGLLVALIMKRTDPNLG